MQTLTLKKAKMHYDKDKNLVSCKNKVREKHALQCFDRQT